jgi:hypothetical protein
LGRAHVSYDADRIWLQWMQAAQEVYSRFTDRDAEDVDDPFSYNERASVGVLVSAAERAGLMSMAEFCTHKGDKNDGNMTHRCDLWIADQDWSHEWAFEFKQVWAYDPKGVLAGLKAARQDAEKLQEDSVGKRAYGVIVSFGQVSDAPASRRDAAIEALRDFIYKDLASEYFVHEFGSGTLLPPTFIILRELPLDS